MKLNVRALGLTLGILWAAGVFIFALAVMIFPGHWGEPLVKLLANVYLGYDATILGALLGAVWGFVDGLVGGILVAWLYNKLAGH